MKKNRIFALLSAVLFVLLSFTGCGQSYVPAEWEIPYSDSVDWKKFADAGITLNVYNWGEYIAIADGEEESFDTIAEFEALTGISVNYTNFSSNEEMYAKLKSGGTSYDIIIPSDYMISRMINEGMLQQLNFDNIPNFQNIQEDLKNPGYDSTGSYSVPYMWGTVGIIYNKTKVDEPAEKIASWDILWNEKYAGNILMFSNSRDAFAIALMKLGYSFNTTDEKEIREAFDALKEQKPLVQAYVMDEIYDKMGGGEAAVAPYYAGDAIVMMRDNPDLEFVVPKEGTNRFVDAMCIPVGAANKEAAELFINFMCEDLVGLKNCEYIGYATPNVNVMNLLDDEIKNNPIIYPDKEVLDNSDYFVALPAEITLLIDNLWTELMSSANGVDIWLLPILVGVAIVVSALLIFIRTKKKARNNY
ncbi:MAG: spermidine/putrescine ABC transporter substrate-binding protein [Clostridiales bacterium]|nr:spermidine/putrescine ABC transporter substrate-binding protein [Clostridiales bacterium]